VCAAVAWLQCAMRGRRTGLWHRAGADSHTPSDEQRRWTLFFNSLQSFNYKLPWLRQIKMTRIVMVHAPSSVHPLVINCQIRALPVFES
jgi:hypothetical protein